MLKRLSRLLWHWFILLLGLYLVTLIKPLGITCRSNDDLAWAALILMVVNTFIKPILVLISLPLVLLTLGLFLLVINAIILYMLPQFVHGLHVPSFTSAFFGALILSLLTGLFTGWKTKTVSRVNFNIRRPINRTRPQNDDKVIDI